MHYHVTLKTGVMMLCQHNNKIHFKTEKFSFRDFTNITILQNFLIKAIVTYISQCGFISCSVYLFIYYFIAPITFSIFYFEVEPDFYCFIFWC